ncbi:hypothetical protein OSJ05_23125 [Mycobacterium ulcerans]
MHEKVKPRSVFGVKVRRVRLRRRRGLPAALDDFTLVWTAEPGIDVTAWPAVVACVCTDESGSVEVGPLS